MLGSKLTQVQTDINNLINDTIPKGNKIALITFNDTATIINDFTDDTTVLQESINNLVASGETNYYQALVKVDEILSTYTKEDNKNCVVLFLTDGLPTIDTPNEIGEYKYLKSKYEYLDINGIQYELGDTVLTGIKNITDNQFIANTSNLKKFLYKASVGTANYEKLILTDYVDTNYFNLDNVTDITTSSGSATIKDNKVTWNLDNLKSGSEAELTIDINLNSDLIGKGGIYPTHTETDVYYKIGDTSVTDTSTKTTVLKDNYTVNYDMNTPVGCTVSGVPSSKTYSVFDTVTVDDSTPTCEGYQFSEWKIVTDVEKVGTNTFIMPEKNVTLRAIWKKLGITKSMDGAVAKNPILYDLIAVNSLDLDTNVDFSSTPTDDNSGIYTIASTVNDEYPVHYYRGNIDNNNVIFAGFCWKIVRTTSTGGVKLIYNGAVKETYSSLTSLEQDKYINISNDATYPYTYDTSTNKWTSTNKTHSTTGTISFSPAESNTYALVYSVSSEENYDKAYFYKDGTELGVYSGTASGTISLGELTSSSVIMVKYTKDSSASSGTDTVTFSLDKASGNLVKSCNNTGTGTQIGTSAFNSTYSSPADVGYMYGTRYTTSAKSAASTSKYVYGNDVTWDGTKYTLTGKYTSTSSWSNIRTTLANKYHYTCLNTTGECTEVCYIHYFGDSSNIYCLTLSSGENIEDVKAEMFTNTTNSTIKSTIDTWYENNMTNYTEKLEDTIFCNDRSLYSGSLTGKDTNAGTSYSYFDVYNRRYNLYRPSVECSNESRDGFTVSTDSGGNGKLIYPVGLLTADEIMLAGGNSIINSQYYLYTGSWYWTLSPSLFCYYDVHGFVVNANGLIDGEDVIVHKVGGVRPAVSLVPGARTTGGDGTVYNPYIIE